MAGSYNRSNQVCMDNGNLAWQDSCVHGVIGSNIPLFVASNQYLKWL